MLKREEIARILKWARSVDSQCELFGTAKHKYQLNPPIGTSFVRALEEKCLLRIMRVRIVSWQTVLRSFIGIGLTGYWIQRS